MLSGSLDPFTRGCNASKQGNVAAKGWAFQAPVSARAPPSGPARFAEKLWLKVLFIDLL